MKQFMPKKPRKWGFKLWVLFTSDASCVVDFNVYTGLKDGQSEEEPHSKGDHRAPGNSS